MEIYLYKTKISTKEVGKNPTLKSNYYCISVFDNELKERYESLSIDILAQKLLEQSPLIDTSVALFDNQGLIDDIPLNKGIIKSKFVYDKSPNKTSAQVYIKLNDKDKKSITNKIKKIRSLKNSGKKTKLTLSQILHV